MTDYNLFQLTSDYSIQGETFRDIQAPYTTSGIFMSAAKYAAATNLTRLGWNYLQDFIPGEEELSVEELKEIGIEHSHSLTRNMANYKLTILDYERQYENAVYSAQFGPLRTFAHGVGGSLAGALIDPAAILTSFGVAVGITKTLKAFDLLKHVQQKSFAARTAARLSIYGSAEAALNIGHGQSIASVLEIPYTNVEKFADAAFGLVFGTLGSPRVGLPKATQKQLKRIRDIKKVREDITKANESLERIRETGKVEEPETKPITIQDEFDIGLKELNKLFNEDEIQKLLSSKYNKVGVNLRSLTTENMSTAIDTLSWNLGQFNKIEPDLPLILASDKFKKMYNSSVDKKKEILSVYFNIDKELLKGDLFDTADAIMTSFQRVPKNLINVLENSEHLFELEGDPMPIYDQRLDRLIQLREGILREKPASSFDRNILDRTVPDNLIEDILNLDKVEMGDKIKQLNDIVLVEYPDLVDIMTDWMHVINKNNVIDFEEAVKLLPYKTEPPAKIIDIEAVNEPMRLIAPKEEVTAPSTIDKKQLEVKKETSEEGKSVIKDVKYKKDPDDIPKPVKVKEELKKRVFYTPQMREIREAKTDADIKKALNLDILVDRHISEVLRKKNKGVGPHRIMEHLNDLEEPFRKKKWKEGLSKLSVVAKAYNRIHNLSDKSVAKDVKRKKDPDDTPKPTKVEVKRTEPTFQELSKKETDLIIRNKDKQENAKKAAKLESVEKVKLDKSENKSVFYTPQMRDIREAKTDADISKALNLDILVDRHIAEVLRKSRKGVGPEKIMEHLDDLEKTFKKNKWNEGVNKLNVVKNTYHKLHKPSVEEVIPGVGVGPNKELIEIPIKEQPISDAPTENEMIKRAVADRVDVDSLEYKQFLDAIENDQNNLRRRYALYQQTKHPLIKKELELDYPFSMQTAQRKRNKKILKNEFAKFGVQLPTGFVRFVRVVKGQIPFLSNMAQSLYSDWLDFRYFEDIDVINRLNNDMKQYQKNWLFDVKKGFVGYIYDLRNEELFLTGPEYRFYKNYVDYRLTGDKQYLKIIQEWRGKDGD